MKLNTPYEVSKKAYYVLSVIFKGIIAHREENGKYYIKILVGGYNADIERVIINNK